MLVVLALVLTVTEVYREVMEIVRSRRKLKHWQSWTVQKINEDLSCSHPMWPEVTHQTRSHSLTLGLLHERKDGG